MPGYAWSGNYLVWDLDEFVGVCLAVDAPAVALKRQRPHVTDTLKMDEGEIIFPLKSKYDRTNDTIEGREEAHNAYFAKETLDPPPAENPSHDSVGGCIPAGGDHSSAGGSIPAGQTGGCIPAGIPVDGGGNLTVNKGLVICRAKNSRRVG